MTPVIKKSFLNSRNERHYKHLRTLTITDSKHI